MMMAGKKSPSKKIYNSYFKYMKETSRIVDTVILREIKRHSAVMEVEEAFHGRLSTNNETKPKLRSASVRLAYEILGNKDWKKIVPLCAALECLDTSHYACDDVFDTEIDDKKTTNNLVVASHLLYSSAVSLVLSLEKDFGKEKTLRVLNKMNELHVSINKGFYSENFLSGTSSFKKNVERIKYYNFWVYLMEIVAILGNAPREYTDALSRFGNYAGIAHTLGNDACDSVKGNEDLRIGKITTPIYLALNSGNERDKQIINKCLGNKDCGEEQIRKATQSIIKSNAVECTRKLAEKYARKAAGQLQAFPDSKLKELLAYTTRITYRNKHYAKIERMAAVV